MQVCVPVDHEGLGQRGHRTVNPSMDPLHRICLGLPTRSLNLLNTPSVAHGLQTLVDELRPLVRINPDRASVYTDEVLEDGFRYHMRLL